VPIGSAFVGTYRVESIPRPRQPGRLQAAGALSASNSAIELLADALCETVP
jgi:hypothetical protein